MFPAVSKNASSGLSIAFPDVCHVPAPPPKSGPGPIPYPSFATTATKSRNQKAAGGSKQGTLTVSKTWVGTTGDEAGTLKNIAGVTYVGGAVKSEGAVVRTHEIARCKNELHQLHQKLQSLATRDPDEWQKVLQDYAVMASALYATLNPE